MTYGAFAADQRTQYAVVRCLEIISEASRRLDGTVQAHHPNVPWRDIADAGNAYRHAYHRVMLDNVRRTVHERLTDLVAVRREELDRAGQPDRARDAPDRSETPPET